MFMADTLDARVLETLTLKRMSNVRKAEAIGCAVPVNDLES